MTRLCWLLAAFLPALCGCGSTEQPARELGSDAAAAGTSALDVGAELRVPMFDEALPERLSSLGLFPDPEHLDAPAQGVWSYEPRWPLWSNGSAKFRGVAVPGSDAQIAPDPDALPAGTLFFKTFAFAGEGRAGLVPVETRIIRLADPVEYYRYRWDGAGNDAVLIDDAQAIGVEVTNSDGDTLVHQIPSERDCKSCHEASESPILGYREIQLGDTPLDFENERTARIGGYFFGNCSHCHNGRDSDLAAFDLRPDAFLENTINHSMEDTDAIGTRIVPGDPQASLLWVAMNGGDQDQFVDRMPLVGVQLTDRVAVQEVAAWIEQLGDGAYCESDCPNCEGCDD